MKLADIEIGETYAYNASIQKSARRHGWHKVKVVGFGSIQIGFSHLCKRTRVVIVDFGPGRGQENVLSRTLVRTWAEHEKLLAEERREHKRAKDRQSRRVRENRAKAIEWDEALDLVGLENKCDPNPYSSYAGVTLSLGESDVAKLIAFIRCPLRNLEGQG